MCNLALAEAWKSASESEIPGFHTLRGTRAHAVQCSHSSRPKHNCPIRICLHLTQRLTCARQGPTLTTSSSWGIISRLATHASRSSVTPTKPSAEGPGAPVVRAASCEAGTASSPSWSPCFTSWLLVEGSDWPAPPARHRDANNTAEHYRFRLHGRAGGAPFISSGFSVKPQDKESHGVTVPVAGDLCATESLPIPRRSVCLVTPVLDAHP